MNGNNGGGNPDEGLNSIVPVALKEVESLRALQRQDGAVENSPGHKLGVVMTIITAEGDDKDYRQILKRARWANQEQRDKFVKAIAVCRLVGAKVAEKVLLDLITANSAGDNGVWIREASDALNHTTLTTYNRGQKKDGYERPKG